MPNEIERIEQSEHFSEAVVHFGLIYLSGQVALENRGKSIDHQIDEVLLRVDRLITEAGGTRETILAAEVILVSEEHIGVFNKKWAAWLPVGHSPARTTFIATLTSADFGLELTITAARVG